MLRYLKWFSIAGVWYPIAFLAVWGVSGACFAVLGWQSGAASMYIVGMFLVFAFAHSFALAALIAAGLFLTRQVSLSWFPLCTATIGALVSAVVSGRVYFSCSSTVTSLA